MMTNEFYSGPAPLLEYRLDQSPCWPRLAVSSMPWARSVSLAFWWGAGARRESADESGIAHFIEHMLFKGTHQRSAHEINVEIERYGGSLNGFTGEEVVSIQVRVPAAFWLPTLDILMDIAQHPSFNSSEVESEREVVLEEIAMVADRPDYLAQELLEDALWPDHPLGRPLTGTEKTLSGFQAEDLRRWYRRNLMGSTFWITAAGAVTMDDLKTQVERNMPFGAAIEAGVPRALIPAPAFERAGPEFRMQRRDFEQVHLNLGFPAFSEQDPRRHALRLLNFILGEGMSSRLWYELREKHGLVYQVSSDVSALSDAGSFNIQLATDEDHLMQSLGIVGDQLRRIMNESPSEEELKRARDYASGQLELGLESTLAQVNWMGEDLLAYGRVLSISEQIENLEAVQPDDLVEISRLLFRQSQMAAAAVGTVPEDQAVLDALGLQ